jgi:hypothetical protein
MLVRTNSGGARRAAGKGLIRSLLLVVAVLAGCSALPPTATGNPADGIAIDNTTDTTVTILYERPDGGTEPVSELAPHQQTVIVEIFAEREGLCRAGRLVAQVDGREIDELYAVCRGRAWAVASS